MRFLILAVLIGLGLVACNTVIERNLYPAASKRVVQGDLIGPSERQFTRQDGAKRQYFWLKVQEPKGTIVYLHGNGSTAKSVASLLHSLTLGYDIAVLEYTGYGPNEGRPSELQLRRDVLGLFDELRQQELQKPLILAGSSLGGALAIISAKDVKVDGLLTFSAFTKTVDLAPSFVRWLLNRENAFDAVGHAAILDTPWMIVHCNRDKIIPAGMAKQLSDAALVNTGRSAPLGRQVLDCPDHPVPVAHWPAALANLRGLMDKAPD